MKRIALLACCAVAALNVGIDPAAAQQPFYRGKRLTVLINFAAGGPTDIEGRLFAKHLARHIDGNPSLIMQNMDGAGGMIGAQYLGEVAPSDGTAMGYLTGAPWIYVSDPQRWRVDFKRYEFVAHQHGTTIYFVRSDVPPGMRVAADIVNAQDLVAGGLSADTSKDLRMRLGLDMLGVQFKYVTGYRSSMQALLAFQRGEIQMFGESPPSYRATVVPQFMKTGRAVPVWWDDVRETPLPQRQMEGLSIPTFPQLHQQIRGTMPSGPLWDAYKTLFSINSILQRVIVLPPGAPRAAYDALSRAVERLNHDKDFAEEAIKVIQFVPDYPTAPDMSARVRAMLVATPGMRRYINEYMKNVPKR
jgi:tripartite-type tricarboxylate transporter receptor subunit TctC